MINTKYVYHYEDLFNAEIEGVTTFFSIQEPNKLSYRDYYGRDYSRLKTILFLLFSYLTILVLTQQIMLREFNLYHLKKLRFIKKTAITM